MNNPMDVMMSSEGPSPLTEALRGISYALPEQVSLDIPPLSLDLITAPVDRPSFSDIVP